MPRIDTYRHTFHTDIRSRFGEMATSSVSPATLQADRAGRKDCLRTNLRGHSLLPPVASLDKPLQVNQPNQPVDYITTLATTMQRLCLKNLAT